MKKHPLAILGLWLAYDMIVGFLYAITPETMPGLRSALAIAQLAGLIMTGGYTFAWMIRSF